MCHYSFSLQLSKCWLLHGEMRCAIKANLSLYSCVNPAMFNQLRSRRAPSRRDESREASIHTERRSAFQRSANPIWKFKHGAHLIPDTWKCSSEILAYPASVLSEGGNAIRPRLVRLQMFGTVLRVFIKSITLLFWIIWLQTVYICLLLWAEPKKGWERCCRINDPTSALHLYFNYTWCSKWPKPCVTLSWRVILFDEVISWIWHTLD